MKHIYGRVITLTLLAAIFLSATNSSVRAQGAPPAGIDRTTPHAQNGLTLLAVTRGDAQGQYTFPVPAGMDFLTGPRSSGPAGGIGLWVRGVKPPAPVLPQRQKGNRPPVRMPYYQNPNASASATALNGDVLPVQIEPVSSFSYNPQGGGQPAPLFLVTVPGGYPDGYPAIDLSVNDSQGHSARWRLIRLSAPYHAIVPPIAVHSSAAAAGATVSVHAWRDTGPSPLPSQFYQNRGVHYEMTAQVPAGSHWVVRIFKRQLEWEAVHPGEMQALQSRYSPQYGRPMPHQILWTTEFGTDIRSPRQDTVQTPYGKYSNYLRLSGELVQTASATEPLTFHDLSVRQSALPPQFRGHANGYTPPPSYEISTKAQSLVTPSGIAITLLPLSALGPQYSQFGGYGGSDSIRLLLRFSKAPSGQFPYMQMPLALPNSPLYKKYHKPVTYTLQAPKPYFLESYGGFPSRQPSGVIQMVENLRLPYSPPVRTVQNGRVTYRTAPNAIPKHLSSLTLNIVQTAELRTIPISFLVPISSKSPVQPFFSVPHRFIR